jgi:O-methyltransferase
MFGRLGLEVRRTSGAPDFVLPVEFTKRDIEIFNYVWDNRLTMGLPQGLTAAMIAAKHAALANIPGDFVECGVWRGGLSLAAKLLFEEYCPQKKVWLFDTFAGMTRPSEFDRPAFDRFDAAEAFSEQRRDGFNAWCYASLDDVRENFERAGADLSGVRFVKGDVAATLHDERNLPETISVLSMDTDFYESTKVQLDVLYPRLSRGGPLLIDDFGYWEGVRKAVEEYFGDQMPLLYYTDLSGRMTIKL